MAKKIKKENKKVPDKIINSNEPCDYCVDRDNSNCVYGRTEFFPSCFKGRLLIEKD
jgi:hypothetical protein